MILKLSLDTAANQLQLKDDEEQQFGENTWNLDDEITATALLKLYELLPQPQKQDGLPLRVLHVQSPGGICHLGSTLSQCYIFSNLKELVITTQRIASDCQMDVCNRVSHFPLNFELTESSSLNSQTLKHWGSL
jgi:hypothetical protein